MWLTGRALGCAARKVAVLVVAIWYVLEAFAVWDLPPVMKA
jgi:hypothetical protein